jgi:hypothetical protein
MQTTMTVGEYTYHLSEYAYTTHQGDLVGYSKSPDKHLAGEIKEIGDDYDWLTPLTPVKRSPLGDTFVMEGVEGEAAITRADLEKELEEEKWLESRRVKPGWQPFTG